MNIVPFNIITKFRTNAVGFKSGSFMSNPGVRSDVFIKSASPVNFGKSQKRQSVWFDDKYQVPENYNADLQYCEDLFSKPNFGFCENYSKNVTNPISTICYSHNNRYKYQMELIKPKLQEKIKQQNGQPLKVLIIGVAQGQEPLTYIDMASELLEKSKSKKEIGDILDLRTVDVLNQPPRLPNNAQNKPEEVLNYLKDVYNSRQSHKSLWNAPIEEVAGRLEKGEYDVVLFNNVIQHMQPKDEEQLERTFQQIADLVAPGGIICADVEAHVIENSQPRGEQDIPVQDRLLCYQSQLEGKGLKWLQQVPPKKRNILEPSGTDEDNIILKSQKDKKNQGKDEKNQGKPFYYTVWEKPKP